MAEPTSPKMSFGSRPCPLPISPIHSPSPPSPNGSSPSVKMSIPSSPDVPFAHASDEDYSDEEDRAERNYHNPFNFDAEAAYIALAKMIIVDELPLSFVEKEGFIRFMETVNPLFKMVTRSTIREYCLVIYDLEKEATMELLEEIKGQVALSVDMWTRSDPYEKKFMAVTAHYIDDNWKPQSRMIRFVFVPPPYTGEVLYETLAECLTDWNIENKLSTVTVNSCSTNNEMMSLLLHKLPKESLLVDESMIHMRCGGYILNLVMKVGLEVIEEAIQKIRNVIIYWKETAERWAKFKETARELGIAIVKKLYFHCGLCLDSTYLMLTTALEYKDVFLRLKHDLPEVCVPGELDWNLTREICVRLEMVYNATNDLCGTKHATSNLYLPIICELKLALDQWPTCGVEAIELMSLDIVQKFEEYWSDMKALTSVAAVLDPRYKVDVLKCYFPKIYPENSESEVEKILMLCRKLVAQYEEKERLKDDGQASSLESNESNPEVFETMFHRYVSQRKRKAARLELDIYLEEDIIPLTPDFDVLLWWKLNEARYPILHKLAKDILAIPVSAIPLESVFNSNGRVISPHRSRLLPETVEALTCTKNWLRAKSEGYSERNHTHDADVDLGGWGDESDDDEMEIED